jgi:hypothetical protein
MARPIWLALIFLIGICALAALKVSLAMAPKQQAALAADVMEVSVNSLAKADRLEVEEIPDKKTIRSIAIAAPIIAAAPAIVAPVAAPKPEKATKITSRHWQDGFAKATMRKHLHDRNRHHHRHVSRKTHPRG